MTVILLAAGLSTRMGRNKLLLPLGEEPVIIHSLKAAMAFSSEVLVVTGHQSLEIEKLVTPFPVKLVYAEDYAKGQDFSMRSGLRAAPDDDFAIVPGDLPLLSKEDYCQCQAALASRGIARCVHNGTPGHPVMFRKEHRERLLTFPGRFKAYVSACPPSLVERGPECILDADTEESYRRLLSVYSDNAINN